MASESSPAGGESHEGETPPSEAVADRPLPPGPDGYPFVGNSLQLMRDPFGFLDSLREYGDVARYEAWGRTFTALFDPADVERVLVEEPDRFERWDLTDIGMDFAPEGLFLSDGEQWRSQRQLMQPAFTMDSIRSYAETMADYAAETAAGWSDGQEVVLNEAFADLTLRVFGKTMFDLGIDPDSDDEAIPRAARVINERASAGNASFFLPEWVPTPANRRYKRAMADFRERVYELLDERGADERRGDGDDLLSILLHAEGPDGYTLSEAEIRDNLLTFMFAGHETTSLALTYTHLLLAEHDDAAATVRAELDDVLDGEQPRFEHVPQLEATENAIREAMRLYPPVYAVWRQAREDTDIGGYRIPEGTLVTLSQYLFHRDERFYDDPKQFDPGRWTEADWPDYAYFPFGGGPRHCIGMRFAMMEMQLVVATLLDRFEFDLRSDPDPDVSPGATLQPENDVVVRVQRRRG